MNITCTLTMDWKTGGKPEGEDNLLTLNDGAEGMKCGKEPYVLSLIEGSIINIYYSG